MGSVKYMNKEHYKYIDLIRVLSCVLILFYHLNILKGGYLVVCTFFVLSGYLSILSAYKKDKFSLIEYYKSKFKSIYLPVIIIAFIIFIAGVTFLVLSFTVPNKPVYLWLALLFTALANFIIVFANVFIRPKNRK